MVRCKLNLQERWGAKKIVAELNKMKKAFAPLKENGANVVIQNGAAELGALVDGLIMSVPAKIAK